MSYSIILLDPSFPPWNLCGGMIHLTFTTSTGLPHYKLLGLLCSPTQQSSINSYPMVG